LTLKVGVLVSSMAAVAAAQSPQFPPPLIQPNTIVKLSEHAYVIPDPEVTLVPNVGVVVGREATLVIDTGMGNRNGHTILAEVAKVSRAKKLFLVTTHSHAEHVSGAGAFPDDATFVVARAQKEELDASAERGFAGMAKLSSFIGELLEGARLPRADTVFDEEFVLDLGGVRVRLVWMGPAHSKGDTVVVVEEEGVVFAGDLAPRQRFLSFTPASSKAAFLKAMARVEALKPRVVVPSHGPYGDASVFAEHRRVLDQMARRVDALKAQGQSLAETVTTVVAELRSLYPAWRATVPNEISPIVRSLFHE
jgi:glyoxylase-like metal-dependent hydrolase (beta-lactamase superfamily II)